MSKKIVPAVRVIAESQRPAPVRVKLRRLSGDQARAYPPDGNGAEWWERLKKALGTSSSAFVDASVFQLTAAARLPLGGISEVAVNAALAFIESVKPQDELEASLVMQMACTHAAAMAVLARLAEAHGGGRNGAMMASAASRLLRAFALQTETLRRLRNGTSQLVRVEHVHVAEGGQAVIGVVAGRDGKK